MRPWTKDERLFLMAHTHLSLRECASALGRSYDGVRYFASRSKIPFRKKVRKILNESALPLYHNGWTDPMIARKFKCCKSAVYYWRRRNDLKPNAPSGSPEWFFHTRVNDKRERLVDLASRGLSVQEIADALGISYKAAWERLRHAGLNKKERKALAAEQAGAQLDFVVNSAARGRKAC